jgi:hypothetical protein
MRQSNGLGTSLLHRGGHRIECKDQITALSQSTGESACPAGGFQLGGECRDRGGLPGALGVAEPVRDAFVQGIDGSSGRSQCHSQIG